MLYVKPKKSAGSNCTGRAHSTRPNRLIGSTKKSAARKTQSVNQYRKTTQMLSLQSEISAICISFGVLQSIAIQLPNAVWIAALC